MGSDIKFVVAVVLTATARLSSSEADVDVGVEDVGDLTDGAGAGVRHSHTLDHRVLLAHRRRGHPRTRASRALCVLKSPLSSSVSVYLFHSRLDTFTIGEGDE